MIIPGAIIAPAKITKNLATANRMTTPGAAAALAVKIMAIAVHLVAKIISKVIAVRLAVATN